MYELAHKVGQVLIAPAKRIFDAQPGGDREVGAVRGQRPSIRKDMQEFYGSWAKAAKFGEEAAKEAARGLVNTPTQMRHLREQQVLLGKYGDFSPRVRAAGAGADAVPAVGDELGPLRVLDDAGAPDGSDRAAHQGASRWFDEEWKREHADLPPSLQRVDAEIRRAPEGRRVHAGHPLHALRADRRRCRKATSRRSIRRCPRIAGPLQCDLPRAEPVRRAAEDGADRGEPAGHGHGLEQGAGGGQSSSRRR